MKVAIAGGGGGVGASVAFNLLLGPDPPDVVLLDLRPEMVTSHVMDLEQVLEQVGGGHVRAGTESDLSDADVVVITAATPLTVNQSRMVYLEANARIVAAVADELPPEWPGVLVVVTNPVDPLCSWLVARGGLDPRRVLGYTLNDSLRLQTGIRQALGVGAGLIDAWMIGEHGDHAVALWDRVFVAGERVVLDPGQRATVMDFVGNWYVRHVALDSGRSSTWTSGLGIARMVRALDSDAGELWPASVSLAGEYGIETLHLSVPVTLARGGVAEIHTWELSPAEAGQLAAGSRFVREAAAQISL